MAEGCDRRCSITNADLTADAFLANNPMTMNLVLHGLDEAVTMMMAVERSRLGRSTNGNDGCQGYGGSKKQVFHIGPRKHWGLMLRDNA